MIEIDPIKRLTADRALNHHWFREAPKQKIIIDPSIIRALQNYKPKSQMQRHALGIIVKYLSLDQLKDLRKAFYDIDTDQTGTLDIIEIENTLKNSGVSLPKTQLAELFRNLDFDSSGKINYSEFLTATMSSRIQLDEQTLWMAFKVFDVEDQGFITPSNLYDVLTNMGKRVTRPQVKKIIEEVALTQNEKISFEEFKTMLNVV